MEKQGKLAGILCAAVLSLFLDGCLDVDSVSKINTDGTITRTITVDGDSAKVYREARRLSIDSSWSVTTESDGDDVRLVAVRNFASTSQMNEVLPGMPGSMHGVEAEFNSRFFGFFTRYMYSETWKRFNPFDSIPVSEYLSRDEIDMYLQHEIHDEPVGSREDSLALENASDSFEKWHARNMFEAWYSIFLSATETIDDSGFTIDTVISHRELLLEKAVEQLLHSYSSSLQDVFEDVFPRERVRSVVAHGMDQFDDWENKRDFVDNVLENNYSVSTIMPGIIVSTNAVSVEGNTVSWNKYMNYCFLDDYQMTVESRVVNWWVIVVAGLLLLGIAAIYITGIVRKRRTFRTGMENNI